MATQKVPLDQILESIIWRKEFTLARTFKHTQMFKQIYGIFDSNTEINKFHILFILGGKYFNNICYIKLPTKRREKKIKQIKNK